jgi:hypothetical protein
MQSNIQIDNDRKMKDYLKQTEWPAPIVPATWEAEARGALEFRSLRSA